MMKLNEIDEKITSIQNFCEEDKKIDDVESKLIGRKRNCSKNLFLEV